MRFDQLRELHYICHSANIPSVLLRGILCHDEASKHEHEDISMQDVQDRRKNRAVPGGLPLHGYVNLYFHARNPMLYKRLEKHEELCVLGVDKNVINIKESVITDGNAASEYIRFYKGVEGLEHLDYDLVFAEFWNDKDPVRRMEKKRMKCSEVLIPGRVEAEYIRCIYVSNEKTLRKISGMNTGIDVIINNNLFFG